MYCVAPIMSPGKASASYDFWAIGRNCCTGAANNFACSEIGEEDAHIQPNRTTGGLRLLSSTELPFYKLAVTQAMTKYGVKSAHPIFVHWVQDSDKALLHHRERGWSSYWPAVAFSAVFQSFLMLIAVVVALIVKSTYPKEVSLRKGFENP